MTQGRRAKVEKVIPYESMSQAQREEAERVILTTVRDTLRKGPNSAIELRSRIPTQHLGAFHVVLECMIRAGEVASIGHSIYAQVPWMPATRPVQADAIMDIVFGALSKTIKVGATAVELASDLTLPKDVVSKALSSLEASGLIRETRQKHRYRLVSTRMAQHVRQGASGRIFADVRHG